MDKKFIITKDTELAEKLIKYGYESLGKSGDFFIFENAPTKFNFEEIEPWKYVFTNKLFF